MDHKSAIYPPYRSPASPTPPLRPLPSPSSPHYIPYPTKRPRPSESLPLVGEVSEQDETSHAPFSPPLTTPFSPSPRRDGREGLQLGIARRKRRTAHVISAPGCPSPVERGGEGEGGGGRGGFQSVKCARRGRRMIGWLTVEFECLREGSSLHEDPKPP